MLTETTINYDTKNDILYISLGEPVPSISEEKEEGILIRRDIETGEITGVTILDYKDRLKNNEKIEMPLEINLDKVNIEKEL